MLSDAFVLRLTSHHTVAENIGSLRSEVQEFTNSLKKVRQDTACRMRDMSSEYYRLHSGYRELQLHSEQKGITPEPPRQEPPSLISIQQELKQQLISTNLLLNQQSGINSRIQSELHLKSREFDSKLEKLRSIKKSYLTSPEPSAMMSIEKDDLAAKVSQMLSERKMKTVSTKVSKADLDYMRPSPTVRDVAPAKSDREHQKEKLNVNL